MLSEYFKEGRVSSDSQSIMVGEGWWGKHELTGHTASSVRKEKYQCSDHLVLRIPAEGVDSPHSACVSSLLLTVSWANRGVLRALFLWHF